MSQVGVIRGFQPLKKTHQTHFYHWISNVKGGRGCTEPQTMTSIREVKSLPTLCLKLSGIGLSYIAGCETVLLFYTWNPLSYFCALPADLWTPHDGSTGHKFYRVAKHFGEWLTLVLQLNPKPCSGTLYRTFWLFNQVLPNINIEAADISHWKKGVWLDLWPRSLQHLKVS